MNDHNSRYARHYALKGFGLQAQLKLGQAGVLVIGAGGLGCPALQYLVAAGVGKIGIVDGDRVALSNLQRQVLFDTSDIGEPKATTAARKLRKLNPDITIDAFDVPITTANAFHLLAGYAVVLDCTDNFASRYLINDACVLLKKPVIFAAVARFEGQVAVFNKTETSANYRDLFPVPPDASEVPDCNEAGVLGVLPGIIGTFQATEAIKLICELDGLLENRLLTFNLLTYESFIIDIQASENIRHAIPATQTAFEAINYDWLCGSALRGIDELNVTEFLEHTANENAAIIDVREPAEMPKLHFKNKNIPLSGWPENLPEIKEDHLVVFCQSGKRSLKAAKMLQEIFGPNKKISHLRGGVIALTEHING